MLSHTHRHGTSLYSAFNINWRLQLLSAFGWMNVTSAKVSIEHWLRYARQKVMTIYRAPAREYHARNVAIIINLMENGAICMDHDRIECSASFRTRDLWLFAMIWFLLRVSMAQYRVFMIHLVAAVGHWAATLDRVTANRKQNIGQCKWEFDGFMSSIRVHWTLNLIRWGD